MATSVETPATRTEQRNTEETVSPQQPQQQQQQSTEERIRIRAYELYEQRGDDGGDPESDWYQAENEIVTEVSGHDH